MTSKNLKRCKKKRSVETYGYGRVGTTAVKVVRTNSKPILTGVWNNCRGDCMSRAKFTTRHGSGGFDTDCFRVGSVTRVDGGGEMSGRKRFENICAGLRTV